MEYKKFADIDIDDTFFDTLKADYYEFADWFKAKSEKNESAYVINSQDGVEAFLYLKIEDEELKDLEPILIKRKRLKVGTLKVNPHGTRLGERLIKKTFDYAIANEIREIYVTVFPKHDYLIKLFSKYGFKKVAVKKTHNGIEDVFLKDMKMVENDIYLDYPRIQANSRKKYILAIYPDFHTRLLPDSKLYNEKFDIIKDVSHTNSIHKIYISKIKELESLKKGDLLVIYRTGDKQGPAKYRAVATSVGIVEEIKKKKNFDSEEEYLAYCNTYSVFSDQELKDWYKQSNVIVVKFTYNFALNKRIIRDRLINEVGIDGNQYWGFLEIGDKEFNKILEIGEINESFIIN